MSNAVWSDLGVAGNNREVRATILQLEMQVGSLGNIARSICQLSVDGDGLRVSNAAVAVYIVALVAIAVIFRSEGIDLPIWYVPNLGLLATCNGHLCASGSLILLVDGTNTRIVWTD
jgi:hypothetical protein